MSTKNNVFQLSALSQDDSGAADGSKLICKITKTSNGTLRTGSFPIQKDVPLPIPPGENPPAPATPTWFLIPENGENMSFDLEITGPTGSSYPTKTIHVSESEVKKMASVPFSDRENKIYQKGEYGIIGFAQEGSNGLIYTITAGVLNPRLHGN